MKPRPSIWRGPAAFALFVALIQSSALALIAGLQGAAADTVVTGSLIVLGLNWFCARAAISLWWGE